MKTKQYTGNNPEKLSEFPNFHKTGSIAGMKNKWQILVQLLKEIAEDKGITQREIAEATGYQESNVSRIFSLRYTPRLDVFLNIAKAVGVNFLIEDQDSKADLNLCFERAMTALGRRSLEGPSNN